MYGTVLGASAYHTARNNAEWAAASTNPGSQQGALQKASDYINNTYRKRFPGTKTGGRAQTDEWPRTGAVDSGGYDIPDNQVPVEVEYAAYEGALLILKGVDLNPVTQGGAIKRERVKAGPVETETEYSDEVEIFASFTIMENYLEAILVAFTGTQVALLRG